MYASAFMKAMRPKQKQGKWDRLVYLDLLAGPGLGIDRDTGAEFEGSPLRALRVRPAFDRLFLGDVNPRSVAALRTRIPAEDRGRVDIRVGDCNLLAGQITQELSRRTLGLAFVDPQGFEAGFGLFESLATRQMDVLFLFPGGIGVGRNLPAFARRVGGPLDALMGDSEWRRLLRARVAAGGPLSIADLASHDRPFLLEFQQRMARLGYLYSDTGEPYFANEKNVRMYHLLFFSKNPAGLTIWSGVKRIEPTGQRRLL